MDPSKSSVQDPQNQPASDQPVGRAQQPPVTMTQPSQQTQQDTSAQKQQEHRTQISTGGVEAGATIVQEDTDNEDEELMVAPQETKNNAVMGQNEGGDEDETTTVVAGGQSTVDVEENIVLSPSGPETPVNASPEVEKVLEKSPDLEKPDIPKVLSDAGVTHSGPGVIQVDDNNFGVSQMPAITAQQAATQFKTTHLHDSKHWFVGMLMYIWKKLQADKETETAVVNEMSEEEESVPQS